MSRGSLHCALTCLLATGAVSVAAQTPDFLSGEAAAVPIVRGAPLSGEGVVTVKLTLYDGTRIERSVRAKYHRDSAGRVRREQTVLGLEALDPAQDWRAIVTLVDPVAGVTYVMIPGTHEAQRLPIDRGALASQPYRPPAPPPTATAATTQEESLGTRTIEGITATGRRTRATVPAGQMGNDRPIEITDERWESSALKVLLLSRHHDPRTGDVEYRLTNISQAEPPPELFRVPSGYKIVDVPTVTAPASPRSPR
jgi:hypothetical protein